MKILLVVSLIFSINVNVNASEFNEWQVMKSVDPMTDEVSCVLKCYVCGKSSNKGNSLLVEIRKEKNTGVLFMVSAFLGDNIKLYSKGYFRVDNHEAKIGITSGEFKDYVTHTAIFTTLSPFLDQLKKGYSLKASNGPEIAEMTLIGFTKAYNEYQECELLKKMAGK